MIVLPAIDIRGGQCVRLTQGDYGQEKVYDADPVSIARSFVDQGAEWIHVVDLDAAKSGKLTNRDIVASIAKACPVPIEYGGGVRSLSAAKEMLEAGVNRVVVGTKLVQDRDLATQLFKELGDQIVAGVDARDRKVSVAGWTEDLEIDVLDFMLEMSSLGAKRFVLTDISRDGMLTGPNLDLLKEAVNKVNRPIVQSGGIATLKDVAQVAEYGAEAVIIGKAIYEGNLTVADAVQVGREWNLWL